MDLGVYFNKMYYQPVLLTRIGGMKVRLEFQMSFIGDRF